MPPNFAHLFPGSYIGGVVIYKSSFSARRGFKALLHKESWCVIFRSSLSSTGDPFLQRVLALCYFWDLEKVALGKNRISKIFILCTQ